MNKTIMSMILIGTLTACGGGDDRHYDRGTAIITVTPTAKRAEPSPDVVLKSDLERRDYSDLVVNQQSLTPAIAMRALGVPGATLTRVSDGFVVTVPEDPFFTHPASRINPTAMPYITRLAAAILKDPTVHLDIIANYHYDGMNRKALAESEKRAVAIQAALLSRSVGLSRVRAIGAGDRNPIADNRDPLGQKINRRIEFHFRRG